jgi:uncharacterized membrane protein (DUF4010 family)
MDIQAVRAFGEALAIGLIIGVERYKDRAPGERKPAGVRTFVLFSLLGAISGLLSNSGISIAVFCGLIVLLGIGYFRHSAHAAGLTTEAAAMLTFWLGHLVHGHESIAIATTIVVAILLSSKQPLHAFVRQHITETELFDTLKFLAVVLVVYPLLPDRDMGPYGALNPSRIWMLVVLVSTVSFSGYLLVRVLGQQRGLVAGALAGGLVSTTAATLSLAERARRLPESTRSCAVAGIVANAVQFPRILLLVWIVNPGMGIRLALPLLAMGATGLLGARVASRWLDREDPETGDGGEMDNPYSLTSALKFGGLLATVLVLAEVAAVHLPGLGIYAASAFAGLADASAISLSVAGLVDAGTIPVPVAAVSVFIALTVNAAAKWVLALRYGSRGLALWIGLGLLGMFAVGGMCIAVPAWVR